MKRLKIKRKPITPKSLELNTVYNLDVLRGLRSIPDNSIDCIITSPPYNKVGLRHGKTGGKRWSNCGGNINYDVFDDNMNEDDYQQWQIEILNECFRVLKPTGSMFYNHKVRRHKGQAYFPSFVFNTNFKFYQLITWNRKSSPDGNINYMLPNTELIFWLTKDKPKVFKKECNFNSEVWDISPKPSKEHPAPFPLEIPFNLIKLTTQEQDTILDPFSGRGTTLIEAQKLNRKFIGFEISPHYCNLIKENLRI